MTTEMPTGLSRIKRAFGSMPYGAMCHFKAIEPELDVIETIAECDRMYGKEGSKGTRNGKV